MGKRLDVARIRAGLKRDQLVGFDLSRAKAGSERGKSVKIGIKKTGVTKLGLKKRNVRS